MSLQKKTINRYRHFFPEDTLREVSARTGIQITRIFRLFNGKNMKVAELEAFQNIIDLKLSENKNLKRVENALDEAYSILTNEELYKIANYIERKVVARSYSRYHLNSFKDAIIA